MTVGLKSRPTHTRKHPLKPIQWEVETSPKALGRQHGVSVLYRAVWMSIPSMLTALRPFIREVLQAGVPTCKKVWSRPLRNDPPPRQFDGARFLTEPGLAHAGVNNLSLVLFVLDFTAWLARRSRSAADPLTSMIDQSRWRPAFLPVLIGFYGTFQIDLNAHGRSYSRMPSALTPAGILK
jgi:hypothetical protein